MNREDQFIGAILGLAIGDAIGYPCEFRGRAQILETFGPKGVRGPVAIQDPRWPKPPYIMGDEQPPGTYTDDTQMSIAVARGLVETSSADLDASMVAIGQHFVEWSKSPDNNRSPGSTCMSGCENLSKGMHWSESGIANSKGCGSAMRVAPIGLLHSLNREELLRYARASSLLTHGHSAALEGAAACALMVSQALSGDGPEQMYEAVRRTCQGRSDDFDKCWAKLPAQLHNKPEIALSEAGLGESWIAEEAAASALYCYWQSPDDFAEVILRAANTDGDSDSIACIAGGIAGAALGVDAIPLAWLEVLENAEYLRDLGSQLYQASVQR